MMTTFKACLEEKKQHLGCTKKIASDQLKSMGFSQQQKKMGKIHPTEANSGFKLRGNRSAPIGTQISQCSAAPEDFEGSHLLLAYSPLN